MNRFFSLIAAVALFAAVPATYAQIDFCFVVDQNGFAMEGTMYTDTDVAIASSTINAGLPIGTAVRGTNSAEIRHHAFTFINSNPGGDPGCNGGDGLVDWLTYNGRIVGGGAGSGYIWSGTFENSCEFAPANRTGVIFIGSCPAARPARIDNGDAGSAANEIGEAEVQAAPEAFEVVAAPNPFAAGTVVQFDLPEAAHVRVLVFDTLGRQVAVLADEQREAGTHGVSFEGANLPAGVYLYRVEAGAQVASGQMTLVR